MKDNYCVGFCYVSEEELKELMGIDAYLDMKHDKNKALWDAEDLKWLEKDQQKQETSTFNPGMSVYCDRKSWMMTQKEYAKKLGIGVETLSKVENNHPNIRKSTKLKINAYFEIEGQEVIFDDIVYY